MLYMNDYPVKLVASNSKLISTSDLCNEEKFDFVDCNVHRKT